MPGETKSTGSGGGGKGGGGKRRKKRLAGDILLTSLEQEILQWALHGFQPAGPEGLKPTSGNTHCMYLSLSITSRVGFR